MSYMISKNFQKGISTFQVALMGGAALVAFLGFFMFAGVIPSPWGSPEGKKSYGQVAVWGTIPEKIFSAAVETTFPNSDTVRLIYTEKDPSIFDRDLTEALASGRAPDAVILTQESIVRQKDRLLAFPYSARDLKNVFIEESELYLMGENALGLPIAVDPLVMYWNRDLFSAAGIASPPTSWTELYVEPITKLTKRGTEQGSLTQSAFALGEFSNITHAKDILATLFFQTGNSITEYRAQDGTASIQSTVGDTMGAPSSPVAQALQFYTRFSDPARTEYTWSRALPASIDMFAQGMLGMYFGYASERELIARKNPHLNFDVALMPQAKTAASTAGRVATFGRMYDIAALGAGKNQAGALYVVSALSSKNFSVALANEMGIASARRDVLSVRSTDPYQDVYNRSALISRGWLDPESSTTGQAFRSAVEDVLSGRRNPEDAVNVLNGRISDLLQKRK